MGKLVAFPTFFNYLIRRIQCTSASNFFFCFSFPTAWNSIRVWLNHQNSRSISPSLQYAHFFYLIFFYFDFFFFVCMRLFSLADRRIYSKTLTTSNTRRWASVPPSVKLHAAWNVPTPRVKSLVQLSWTSRASSAVSRPRYRIIIVIIKVSNHQLGNIRKEKKKNGCPVRKFIIFLNYYYNPTFPRSRLMIELLRSS